MKKLIQDAKKGDPVARKLVMDRLVPRLKDTPILPVLMVNGGDPIEYEESEESDTRAA